MAAADLEAIVFDFDGTILDTESPDYKAWQELFAQHGCTLPLSEWAKAVGTRNGFDPYAYLEEQAGVRLDPAEVSQWQHRRMRELVEREAVRPGVMDLLEAARAAGVKVGLASSSSRSWIAGHLDRLGLAQYFQAVCTADDVPEVKPAPYLYLLAVRRLGVSAAGALAIEDSPNGALGAIRAGLPCLVVPNDLTRHFAFPAVNATVDTLAGLTLAGLAEIQRRRA